MTVPEGIVEKKDLKVICAPPWGTNYEMKAKKNTKELSFFYDENDKKCSGPGEHCSNVHGNSHGEAHFEGSTHIQNDRQPKDMIPTDRPAAGYSVEPRHGEGSGDIQFNDFPADKNNAQSGKVSGSQSVQEVGRAKTLYETSNSAYGHHRVDPEGDLPKSYRRVSSFSKLYGDKQPLKK